MQHGEVGTLGSSEKTIAIVLIGDRWWSQTAKQEGDKVRKTFFVIYGEKAMNAQMSVVSLGGVGTVLSLERDAWTMIK